MFYIKTGSVNDTSLILKDASSWLRNQGKELWSEEELSNENLLHLYPKGDFVVGYIDATPVCCMVLQWEDMDFWPDCPPWNSGFIHKLAVASEYHGSGLVQQLLDYAEVQCGLRHAQFLRLDCSSDRQKLCQYYLSIGFHKVGEKRVRGFDVALFEKPIY